MKIIIEKLEGSVNIKIEGDLISPFEIIGIGDYLIQYGRKLFNESNEDELIDDNKYLKSLPIHRLNFSIRLTNCLRDNGIIILSDLLKHSMNEISQFKNFGNKSKCELIDFLEENKLKLKKY